ncbi:hypothetical protein FQR65_LT12615 [Abscondita terminalis]|nr:hypothetical protein FQR65_LT12615 [Abscondita terminalis]
MKGVVVLLSIALLGTAWSSCVLRFDDASKECAEPYGYTDRQVFEFFYSGYKSKDAPNLHLFVECSWRKWGFLNENGDINYQAIKNTKIPLTNLLGICDDAPVASPKYATAFVDSVDQCEREAPDHLRAETIRSCIAQRWKEHVDSARMEVLGS